MKIENVVWVDAAAMTDLLESGILPPAVIARATTLGRIPYTHAAPAKMIEQATYVSNGTVINIPGLYLITVKCTDERGYPLRVAVAELDVY